MTRILVAEDDPGIRELMIVALRRGHHEVVAVADGRAAIAALDAEPHLDAVVTDYSMPFADGIDVILHAQHVDPMLPCIIVTAFHDLDLAVRGMQCGAVGFIPKPFRAEHLLTVVARAVERRVLAAEVTRLRVFAPMLERFAMILANTLESKDLSTSQHSERLAALADGVGVRLGLSGEARTRLRLGAGLHDVGKVAVPEAVLNKAEPLTEEERARLRTHPDVGASILDGAGFPDEVALIIRHHHERFDGGGYPSGLRGEQIPLPARIVGVADAVDVMLFGRVYCAPKPLDAVVAELERERGRQFDPEVVDAVIACLDAGVAVTAPA